MIRVLPRLLATAALLVLIGTFPLAAQQDASIRGTILDEQGEAVVGATVTAVHGETGLLRTTVTGESGTYALPELPVGRYVLTVEAEGFKLHIVQNVELNIADIREIDGRLEVGPVSEAVTVLSGTLVPETVGGEVAGLITGEQVRELPLNGRNFMQLTQLMPGVVTTDTFNTKDKGVFAVYSRISVAGGQQSGNLWTVDGANNNDVGANWSLLVYPSLEAIEEFKIHRNAYGAEFGGATAAQINLVTRSGTNQLRGSVFYFARRGSWNETNYILERADVEPDDLTRDDYGFTLGGPIIKDKVHFFASAEWNDEVRGNAVSAGVPTAAEKRGDFSRSDAACRPIPVDPLTGQPFPGNVVPPERLSEAGLLLLELYPDANISGCLNWVTALDVPIDWNQINARLDWSVTEWARFMIRYTEDDWQNTHPTARGFEFDPFPQIDSAWGQPSLSIVAQLHTVLGASALNTLTGSLTGNEVIVEQAGNAALQRRIRETIPPSFPAEGKLSYPNTTHPGVGGGQGLTSLGQFSPWFNDQDMFVVKDDYEQLFGEHSFKTGIFYTDAHKLEPTDAPLWEMPYYWGSTGLGGWGTTSGNLIADLLIEDMTFGFFEDSRIPRGDLEWTDLELYAADSWRLRDNLTVDFGVRYSRFYWPENVDGSEYLSFNPDRFDPALGASPCNGLMQVSGTDPCGAAGFPGATDGPNASLIHHNDNVAPRLGAAWDVFGTGKSVLRAGFGQFFGREQVAFHLSLLRNPPGVQYMDGIRSLEGDILFLDSIGSGAPRAGIDVDAESPFLYQYNLTWEQRLGREATVEVSYVGSQGRNLVRSRDINQVPLNRDVDSNGVNDRLDYVRCSTWNQWCKARYRPVSAYGDRSILFYDFDGSSEYNSLQAQLISRFGRGSQFQASYTLADFTADTSIINALGGFNANGDVTDIYRPGSDEGEANMRRRHVFNSSVIYNLPTFEGQGGVQEWVLGNWSVGGIVIYATGTPLTVFSPIPGGDLEYTHPAKIGESPTRPLATGVPCGGTGDLGIVNPAAYTLTGYELGNSAQQMPRGTCDGPDFFQTDLAFYKALPFTQRFTVQLRFEVFNVFNTVNLIGESADLGFNPVVTLDAPRSQATVVTATGPPAATFGLATQARESREIQLGVKLTF